MTTGTSAMFVRPGYLKLELRGGIGGPDAIGTAIYYEDVRKKLVAAWNVESLMIVVNSCGGSVAESDKLFSVIRAHPAKHKVAIVEVAASAAVKVVLACPKRWARHNAELMIHQIQIAPPKRWTADRHAEAAARLKNSDATLAAFYAQRTGKKDANWFLRRMRAETIMSPQDAMECGLVHKVLDAPAKPAASEPLTYAPESRQPRQTFYITRDMVAPGARAVSW
jgi:ATP-dependent protease ClpP protease subunit